MPSSATVQYQLFEDVPLSLADPIRIKITASQKNELIVAKSYVRLRLFTEKCSDIVKNGSNVRDVGLMPNSLADPSASDTRSWVVQFPSMGSLFKNNETDIAFHLCFSNDGAKNFNDISSTLGNSINFRYWKRIPSAYLSTKTPKVSTSVNIFIPASLFSDITKAMFGLTTSIADCQSPTPVWAVQSVSGNQDLPGVTLTLPSLANYYYLCVQTDATSSLYSVIPIDFDGIAVRNGSYTSTGEENPSGIGFQVYDLSYPTATFGCQPSNLVQGYTATCFVNFRKSVNVQNTVLLSLTDGQGIVECPTPLLFSHNSTTIKFTFNPRNWGRYGSIKISYDNKSVLFETNAANDEYYQWLHLQVISPQRVFYKWYQDDSLSRFFVSPGFSDLIPYSNDNLLGNITSFTGYNSQNFVAVRGFGFDGYVPSYDPSVTIAVTLVDAKDTGTLSTEINIGNLPRNCRFLVPYYFTGEASEVLKSNTLIGRVVMKYGDGTKTETIRSYELFSYLRQVIVQGGDITPSRINGDLRTVEQLTGETNSITGFTKYNLELYFDHSTNKKLYFLQPELKCESPSGVLTNEDDVALLKYLYQTIKKTSSPNNPFPLRWADQQGNQWEGDPCISKWQGVTCINSRVVGLDLSYFNLTGTWPLVDDLKTKSKASGFGYLETLNLRNNNFDGVFAVPTSWNRLQNIDISHNKFSSVTDQAKFALNGFTCLKKFVARNNLITSLASPADIPLLKTFDVSHNLIDSPAFNLNLFQELEFVSLSENRFTGTLPTLPCNSIRSVDFSRNKFTGPIPTTWTNFRNLHFLDFSYNNLTGKVPTLTLSEIRRGYRTNIIGSFNKFISLVPHLGVNIEGWQGNSFQCPLPYMYEKYITSHYAKPLSCDWRYYKELPLML